MSGCSIWYGQTLLLLVGTVDDVLVSFGMKAVIYEHNWFLVFQLLTMGMLGFGSP